MVSNVGQTLDDFSIPTSQRTTGSDLGQADFLKLMVEQMRNQNPLQPQDNSEFFSQIAQFQTLDAMNVISEAITTLVEISELSNASSLIGREITAEVAQGPDPETGFPRAAKEVTGVVDRVTFDQNGAVLHVGDLSIPSTAVVEISDPVVPDSVDPTAQLLAQLEALGAFGFDEDATAELLAQLEALGVLGTVGTNGESGTETDGDGDAVGTVEPGSDETPTDETASDATADGETTSNEAAA